MKRELLSSRLISFLAAIAMAAVTPAFSQELNCTVEVNSSSVEGTYKNVFDELQREIRNILTTINGQMLNSRKRKGLSAVFSLQ